MRNFHYHNGGLIIMEDRDAIEELIKEDCDRKITKLNLDIVLDDVPQIEW